MRSRFRFVALALASAAPAPLVAQSPVPDTVGPAAPAGTTPRPGAPSFVGRVTNARGEPMPDAEVRLVSAPQLPSAAEPPAVRTDSAGRYQLAWGQPGAYLLEVRRLGFAPVTFSATLGARERRRTDVVLEPLPQQLSAVQVHERSGYSALSTLRDRDAARRRAQAFGLFLTRDDLVRRFGGFTEVSQVVGASRMEVGACTFGSTVPQGAFAGQGEMNARAGCAVQILVDGWAISPDPEFGNLPLDEVEALEIYASRRVPPSLQLGMPASRGTAPSGWVDPATIPLLLAPNNQATRDGLTVVVWTGRRAN